jgi:hypothetical protein
VIPGMMKGLGGDDSNGIAGIIVARKKPTALKKEESYGNVDQDTEAAEKAAVGELLDGIYKKSPGAVLASLKAIFELCSKNWENSEESLESPEGEGGE